MLGFGGRQTPRGQMGKENQTWANLHLICIILMLNLQKQGEIQRSCHQGQSSLKPLQGIGFKIKIFNFLRSPEVVIFCSLQLLPAKLALFIRVTKAPNHIYGKNYSDYALKSSFNISNFICCKIFQIAPHNSFASFSPIQNFFLQYQYSIFRNVSSYFFALTLFFNSSNTR